MPNIENIKSKIKSLRVETFIKIAIAYNILLFLLSFILRLTFGHTDNIELSLIVLLFGFL
jgi:hypothetical protein